MRRTTTYTALVGVACATLAAPAGPAVAATGDHLILAGDHRSHRILALDPAVTDWNDPGAVKWQWAPTTGLGFTAAEAQGFVGGNDFRLRDTAGGRRVVVVDGGGLVTVVSYPSGVRVWANRDATAAADNRHSAELLPDGNVAVAASNAGHVRVYAASQGPGATTYGSFALPGAHAALWDPQIGRLWVAGDTQVTNSAGQTVWTGVLTALEVTGSPAAPGLREDVSRRQVLDSQWAHDVSADAQDPGKLWVTTNARTYRYDKATRRFQAAGAAWDRPFVKAVGTQPSGQVVETMIDVQKSPQGACYLTNTENFRNWCTDTVDFFGPDMRRTRTGAAFYKARVMNPAYSADDQSLRGKVWDRTRPAAGDWSGAATQIDGNAAIRDVAATATPDGRMHVVTLVPGSGLWARTRGADGGWTGSATQLDTNGSVSDVALTGDSAGRLHLFALIPGSGVWYRKRTAAGDWDDHAVKIDDNASIATVAAAASPVANTVHVFGLIPGSGVWHRSGTTAGVWDAGAEKIDANGELADVSAAALPDGTLNVFTVTHGGSVFHRVRSAGKVWQSSTPVPVDATKGQVTGVAAAGWPASTLELVTVRSGLGAWLQTRAGGTWPAAAAIDTDGGTLCAYAVHLTDGSFHVGKITEIS
ncbi:DUF6528 family protein [Actinoplanes teichomyceticus]|uniref:Pyrroloquinoline-quinone binding quinoprotein n=1 Tax=Actinoplanes teichomyceticus TaxID=1867 RepID=A0A561VJ09_ACTTI|nr:DUF6528 family protein [Actinoplanes teichomyceticus]TWG11583.1 hypothetical protein FHX34_106313 [Actinoplanes teichomyceticus]GIF16028.1 hypothetical protein Ate01nite_60600 [Actinoplanes teichomyceticus]